MSFIKLKNLPSYWSSNKYSISFSRLSALLECPLRHYMQYIMGMRVDKDIPAINMGSVIHEVLEEYHTDREASTPKEAFGILFPKWEKKWTKAKDDGLAVADKRTSFRSNLELGKMLIAEYIRNYRKGKTFQMLSYKYPNDPKSLVSVEVPFKIPITDLRTGEILVENYNLTGLIDQVAMIDGKPMILDHKCASIKLNGFLLENDLQLVIYAYVLLFLARKGVLGPPEAFASFKTDNPEVNVGFNYLLKPYSGPNWGNKRKEPTFERAIRTISMDEINGVMRIARDAIKSFEHGWDRATPSYGDHCNWKCDLTKPCRAHRLMKDPLDAFEKEYGKRPEKKLPADIITQNDLF